MNYFCNICEKSITLAEFDFSMDKFDRALCREHQKNNIEDNPTFESKRLYLALKKANVPAKLELHDGHKHIDIAIPEARVNIEVDGVHHNFDYKQALSDLKRTYFSFKKGYLTLRIPNSLINGEHFQETVGYIVEFLNESTEQMEEDDDF